MPFGLLRLAMIIEITDSQAKLLLKLLKDRMRYLRQADRKNIIEKNELLNKKVETVGIIQSLGAKGEVMDG